MAMTESMLTDVGPIRGGYQQVIATAYLDLGATLFSQKEVDALVGPSASIPIQPFLSRQTKWRTCLIFDERDEHVAYQRSKIIDQRVMVVRGDVHDALGALPTAEIVVNPFGYQEFPDRQESYLKVIAGALSERNGLYVTLDWGPTRYADKYAAIPGIADDIAFSTRHSVPDHDEPFHKVYSHEYLFAMTHTVDEVREMVPSEAQDTLNRAAGTASSIAVGSSLRVRAYELRP